MQKKPLRDRIEEIEKKGYDKNKFCSPSCALIGEVCDYCYHYDFKGGDCGVYLNIGECDIHGAQEPHYGTGCEDYICFNVKEKPERKAKRLKQKELIKKLRAGENICEECWAKERCSRYVREYDDDTTGS